MIANDGNPLIFAQEVNTNENIRTKETGNTGDGRPKTSVHQNINGQGTESVRDGGNNSGLSKETRSGDGGNVLLSQWGKSADSGNVRVDNGQIEDKNKPILNETKSDEQKTPTETESVKIEQNTSKIEEQTTSTATTKNDGTKQIADYVADKLSKGEKITAMELSVISTKVFGGTMADNVYTVKDAYDDMELGVNKYILSMEDVLNDINYINLYCRYHGNSNG